MLLYAADIIYLFGSLCRGIPIIRFAAINNDQVQICESVLQIFDTPGKTTEVVANSVVEKEFDRNCCS